MSDSEKSAVKSLLMMHRTYAELDEYLQSQLKEAGYAGVEVQKNPIGTRLTVFVTRPGLAIGRRGTGIKDLTERVGTKFGMVNPQIAVSEVESPELNPRIMAVRISQIVARGTAFRRAATWTMNSIMAAGAAGVEISVAGKLRSDRSHMEKYRMGVVPKSGESATRVVRQATTDVLLKLGLYGIQVKIAVKDAIPPAFEFIEEENKAELPAAAPQKPTAEAAQTAAAPVAAPVAAPEVPAQPEATEKPPKKHAKERKPRAPKEPKEAKKPEEAPVAQEAAPAVQEVVPVATEPAPEPVAEPAAEAPAVEVPTEEPKQVEVEQVAKSENKDT
jgi:small subunit ribosomal protein S3